MKVLKIILIVFVGGIALLVLLFLMFGGPHFMVFQKPTIHSDEQIIFVRPTGIFSNQIAILRTPISAVILPGKEHLYLINSSNMVYTNIEADFGLIKYEILKPFEISNCFRGLGFESDKGILKERGTLLPDIGIEEVTKEGYLLVRFLPEVSTILNFGSTVFVKYNNQSIQIVGENSGNQYGSETEFNYTVLSNRIKVNRFKERYFSLGWLN